MPSSRRLWLSLAALLTVLFLARDARAQYLISTLAGGGLPVTPVVGTAAEVAQPTGMATDAAGNLYFISNNCVFRLDLNGVVTRVAGNGIAGYSGDTGPAIGAQLNNPYRVALDLAGNLYIADTYNSRVRKVTQAGIITTVAGGGMFFGDGGQATSASLAPYSVAVDAAGNLYIADASNDRIRKVSAQTGIIGTVAGNGTIGFAGDNGPALSAEFSSITDIAIDAAGNLYIADEGNLRVRKVSTTGIVTTVAGNGTPGYTGDNGAATLAQLQNPFGVTVDTSGNLYLAEYADHRVRKVSSAGIITTVAGTSTPGYSGDGGPATSAQLNYPYGVAVDASSDLYIADNGNNRIRKVLPSGIITTVAGGGSGGDTAAAVFSQLNYPTSVAKDSSGNVYIADAFNHRVRKVSPSGIMTTVAGTGVAGYSGDSGPAISAQLNMPYGVAVDSSGNLYIADRNNQRIRKVSVFGVITTVAGTGVAGYSGDNASATSAQLQNPFGVAVDANANLYIADFGNARIRKVSTSGTITTVAGTGTAGFSGDGGTATSAQLNGPTGVAADGAGNIYIVDNQNQRIRKVTAAGIIGTVTIGGQGVAVDQSGNLFITNNPAIEEIPAAGGSIVTIVAGNGTPGYAGDGGPALSAELSGPLGLAVDSAGNVYVADSQNNRVRVLTPQATAPVLSILVSHTGNFTAGQNGATYTVLVGNASAAGPATGGVAVTETLPTGLALLSMSGTGWSCAGAVCTRSDTLMSGATYPPITVTALVAINAPAQVTNQAVVSGSGGVLAGGSDLTIITPPPPPPPVLLSPASGATGVSLAPVLSWSPASGATSYDVYFGTAVAPPYVTTVVTTSYTLAALTPGTIYYWKVVANNSGGSATSLISSFTTQTPMLISTVAGGALFPTPVAGTAVEIIQPKAVAVGAASNVYLAVYNSVFKLDPSGMLLRMAGTGLAGYSGDNGTATSAQLNNPTGMVEDASGNVYIADYGNYRVRKVATTGIITTVAGNSAGLDSGDGGLATNAGLVGPFALAMDAAGNLYIGETGRVRKVSTLGIITTFAGTSIAGYSGDGGPATSAQLSNVTGLAVDSAGNLYIADDSNHRIRKVATTGTITTVAGNGTIGYNGDGSAATSAQLLDSQGVAVDGAGNLYIADGSKIREVFTYGIIGTVAGSNAQGFSGDGGPATKAQLVHAYGVAADPQGNFYIADSFNNRVRKVSTAGVITTVVGGGAIGDGALAVFGQLWNPSDVAEDSAGNLYVADADHNVVRKIAVGGIITTVAGTGTMGYSGDNGPAISAQLAVPLGVAVDGSGNLYIGDSANYRIRKVTPSGVITTVAGTGGSGSSGDNGPATSAQIGVVARVAVDTSGNFYIVDSLNNRVRKVSPAGVITTVAGTGTAGFSGDGGPATSAQLDAPNGAAVDAAGNLYIADSGNYRIRMVSSTTGTISTVAGNPNGSGGDGGPAINAQLQSPNTVALDAPGNLYIADNYKVRVVSPAGIINTVAGTGALGYAGDGGPATSALLYYVTGLAVDPSGRIYLADEANNRIRLLTPEGNLPLLSVVSSHTGSFTAGQNNATYTLTVANTALAGPTSGTVLVNEIPPSALSVVSMTGAGWNCAGNACTRGDVLNGGASYPPITVTVNVSNTEPQLTNQASVSGGGSLTAGSSDLTVTSSQIFNNAFFVGQLYLDLLGRAADPAGLSYWLGILNGNQATRPQLAYSFFTSPEFEQNGLFVISAYIAVLGRNPDYAGWLYNLQQLQAGVSQTQLLGSFIQSPEFQQTYGTLNNTAFVQLVYQNVLGRAADAAGLNYWVGLLNSGAATEAQVMYAFTTGAEFQSRIQNQALATLLYMGFLRRSPDPTGVAYWTGQLNAGVPPATVLAGFITSPEYIARF